LDRHAVRGLALAAGLGIGVGLMIGSAFVAMASGSEITEAEIIARARTLGMVSVTELPPRSEAPKVDPPAPEQRLVLVIRAPMTFEDVAAMLKEGGAIPDTAAFLTRVKERGARLNTGVFTFTQAEFGKVDALIDKLALR